MLPCSRAFVAVAAGAIAVLAGCGDSGAGGQLGSSDGDRPTVVVATNILGDVVANLVGDEMKVVTIMPVGADPHDFQASAQQVEQIETAGVLIVNGGGFEEGLLDVIESAEADGVPTFAAISAVDANLEDPHFFADPSRMVHAASGIAAFLEDHVVGLDVVAIQANADAYIAELEALDAEVEATLAQIPEVRRILVTNHEVFGYFADRYDFEVVGTVIPRGTTVGGASAGDLAQLVEVIEREKVPAIFADTSSSDELAATLADEVGEIEVVELFSESLGGDDSEGSTYIAMMRANAKRIAAALAG